MVESKKEMALISAGDNKLRAIPTQLFDSNKQKAINFEREEDKFQTNEQNHENPLSQFFCGRENCKAL